NLTELELILQKALERKTLEVENQGLRAALRRHEGAFEIIGGSQAITRLMQMTERIAGSETSVLIEGESGTGKELVARAVHALSPRAAGPFVPVNCGALPGQLLESELFGHARGAFTGAVNAKPGLVELAETGTLFLDEIAEMALELQAKLLRFLESHEVRRVGDTRLHRVDVRVVAATNRRLADEVKAGRFREDLYYRLNVVALHVPPLRERREDIPLLVEHFLARIGSPKELTPEALDALRAYSYPGNVRELFNLVQRGAILSPDRFIAPEDLGLTTPAETPLTTEEFTTLEEMEKRHIARALAHTGWNRAQAAQLLGISVRNLYRKIEGFDLQP
ncbi:MAG TPA: sigma-54 dependent transcriptional regulator, partial [Symbiobacteriaceae bacterium]|nr:sigma-54 dependent transcriptional regulator [Symbiobacteriaceae bacterium]